MDHTSSPPGDNRADRERQAGIFLKALFGGYDSGMVEFRCLKDDGRGNKATSSGWMALPYSGAKARDSVARVFELDAAGWDVFVGVLPRKARVGRADAVEVARWVWCDLDAKLGMTPEQERAAIDASDMAVRSGTGLHVYGRLPKPQRFPTEKERKAFQLGCRMWQKTIHPESDNVRDASRILRLPGTHNHKTGTPQPVTLLKCDRLVFSYKSGERNTSRPEDVSPVLCPTQNTPEQVERDTTLDDCEVVLRAGIDQPGLTLREAVATTLSCEDIVAMVRAARRGALPQLPAPVRLTRGRLVTDPNTFVREELSWLRFAMRQGSDETLRLFSAPALSDLLELSRAIPGGQPCQ